jgi:uncharacterized membrane protein
MDIPHMKYDDFKCVLRAKAPLFGRLGDDVRAVRPERWSTFSRYPRFFATKAAALGFYLWVYEQFLAAHAAREASMALVSMKLDVT